MSLDLPCYLSTKRPHMPILQCLEHCTAAWHGCSASGAGWDVNSEHVSSSAIPMSLPLPRGEHKVEQACFHGRMRRLTVK